MLRVSGLGVRVAVFRVFFLLEVTLGSLVGIRKPTTKITRFLCGFVKKRLLGL